MARSSTDLERARLLSACASAPGVHQHLAPTRAAQDHVAPVAGHPKVCLHQLVHLHRAACRRSASHKGGGGRQGAGGRGLVLLLLCRHMSGASPPLVLASMVHQRSGASAVMAAGQRVDCLSTAQADPPSG
jgi:hypothetical protein